MEPEGKELLMFLDVGLNLKETPQVLKRVVVDLKKSSREWMVLALVAAKPRVVIFRKYLGLFVGQKGEKVV